MTGFPSVVETYLGDLRRIRASGGATAETSSYTPLENLLNAVGAGLKPKVFCVGELVDQGAGHPDFGLYAAKQVQRGGQPRDDQLPEHGAVEVKPAEDDAWLTIGCQCLGSGQTVMPGHRRAVERPYTGAERAALGTAPDTLGDTTYDIHLNDNAYWRNVPAAVWNCRLGGYQVLKKWLSYRERKVLGQELRVEEVGYFSEVARRIGAILLITTGE